MIMQRTLNLGLNNFISIIFTDNKKNSFRWWYEKKIFIILLVSFGILS